MLPSALWPAEKRIVALWDIKESKCILIHCSCPGGSKSWANYCIIEVMSQFLLHSAWSRCCYHHIWDHNFPTHTNNAGDTYSAAWPSAEVQHLCDERCQGGLLLSFTFRYDCNLWTKTLILLECWCRGCPC